MTNNKVISIKLDLPITNLIKLPAIEGLGPNSSVEITFGPKVVFNSIGIRDWINWLQPVASNKDYSLKLHNCPDQVISLMNMITDFVPENTEIVSFYLPFYSEATDENKTVLMIKGIDFTDDSVKIPKVLDRDGGVMEADIDERKFFRFLKGNPVSVKRE